MKRTDARVRYTQRVLKESLLSLLKEKPINKITVKEVCELAELNRATFYAHYSDCFSLLESIENELVEEFRLSLDHMKPLDVSSLIEAIYGIVEKNQTACQVLVFGNTGSSVLQRMIDAARDRSIDHWRKVLGNASEEDLEMLYIHLSNGLMHVVVEGYARFSREAVVEFIDRMAKNSLALFR